MRARLNLKDGRRVIKVLDGEIPMPDDFSFDTKDRGLLVGYSMEDKHERIPAGFSFGGAEKTAKTRFDPYLFYGEGHLLTVAPTGAGKGVSCVIPAALRHAGDLVVIDPKGENFAITSEHRAGLGQEVCLFDPFGVITNLVPNPKVSAGGINLFDLLPYLADGEQAAAQALAGMILQQRSGATSDPFWDMSACNLLAGLVDFYANDPQGGTVSDLISDLYRYPKETNKLEGRHDKFLDLIARDREVADILKRFRIEASALKDAYAEHLKLINGELISPRTLSPEDQLRMFPDDYIDEVPFGDREVLIENRQFDVGVVARAGIEPDDATIERLLKFVQGQGVEPEPLYSQQSRIERFLNAAQQHDISYPLAILRMMSSERALPERVSAMISGTPDKTWGSMLTTLQNGLGYLNSDGVMHAISSSSLDLDRFKNGEGTSVYLVFPPHRLATHSKLLSTLFKGLINVLVTRKRKPKENTLFLLDEAAQLGYQDEFLAAKTLLRGYGVQVWSFWQDLSQLQHIYPGVWPTIINNCKVFQAFGCATPMMAAALDQLFNIPEDEIFGLEENEMVLSVYGDEPVIALKPKYFADPIFSGQFRKNPMLLSNDDAENKAQNADDEEKILQRVERRGVVFERRKRKVLVRRPSRP